MYQSFNIQFYCRNSKATKNGTAPIEAAININGTRRFINLPYKCYPRDFNRARKPKETQQYIDLMRTRINEILTEMLKNAEPITTPALISYLKNGGYKSYTIGDLIDEYMDIQSKRVGKTLSKGVFEKYKRVCDLLTTYIPKDAETGRISPGLMQRIYTETYAKYEASTAAGYMTRLKSIITFALDNNRMTINPFQCLKIVKGNKRIDYLTEGEIQRLINTPIENESLSRIRDCAVFQLSSGIAYIDLCNLKPEDMQTSADGTHYIAKRRMKTDTEYCAVILPEGYRVWTKYNGKLPIISNQKYNSYLKCLNAICYIKTPMHTHIFRHTYCTTLLRNGVNIKTISKAAGHHNSKITEQFYAYLENQTIIDEIGKKTGNFR